MRPALRLDLLDVLVIYSFNDSPVVTSTSTSPDSLTISSGMTTTLPLPPHCYFPHVSLELLIRASLSGREVISLQKRIPCYSLSEGS